MLARIMYATLQHHSALQYSRSLHQIAAFVLVIMGPTREEHAFWTLIGMVNNRLFPATHVRPIHLDIAMPPIMVPNWFFLVTQGQVALGSFIEQGVLQRLVVKKQSGLAPHMTKIESITGGW